MSRIGESDGAEVDDKTLRPCFVCGAILSATDGTCQSCGNARAAGVGEPQAASGTRPADTTDQPSSALPQMRLTPGTRIACYRIESVIGEGGMGVVYRAHDLTHDRAVALKVLHTNLAGDAGIRRRFAREARILRAYSHPNIVKIFDFVEHEHLLAIVMEVVDGPSLTKYLEKWRGVMPLAEIRDIFSGVLLAIEQGHRLGVVHRDLKPDNVLVTRVDGAVCPKVVDFGIARILEGTTYTVTGALLGTCCYMSPEQIQHPELADARSDIYSLGISLYQLCTGSVPFEGNHFSVMMAHVNQAPRSPSELRADLPPLLERLVLDSIAKDPQARPASCSVFRQRLVEALSNVSPRQPSVESLPPLLKGPLGDEMIYVLYQHPQVYVDTGVLQ